jgi:hypothetical protein
MRGVSHVAGDRRDVGAACQLVAHEAEAVGIASGDDEIPSSACKAACEREPEST